MRRPNARNHGQIVGRLSVLTTAVLFAACGSGTATTAPGNTPAGTASASSSGAGAAITATEADFKIDLSASSAKPGPVTFRITNTGTQVHEFVLVRTDLADDKLPLASPGTEVDEDAGELTAVDEVEDIAAGASADLDVTLEAGHYVLFCNVPGHYPLGMHADFTVAP